MIICISTTHPAYSICSNYGGGVLDYSISIGIPACYDFITLQLKHISVSSLSKDQKYTYTIPE